MATIKPVTNNIKATVKTKVVVKESNDSEKYKITLKLLNHILLNLKRDLIDDITKFKDIDRDDIIKEENTIFLETIINDIVIHFEKNKVGYYRRHKTKASVLNCLRGMIKSMGYEFVKVQKGKTTVINGRSYEKSCMIYSVL